MRNEYKPVPLDEVMAGLAPERQARFRARATELIAEEIGLRDLRRAKRFTQEQVAERLGGRQVYVSRLEKRADMKLSTLRDYVHAIGGDLQLVVTFPEGDTIRLKEIGKKSTRQRSVSRDAKPPPKAARTRAG